MNFSDTEKQFEDLLIYPRRIVPRKYFWPIFILLILLISTLIFTYLDRFVWHSKAEDVLPADTTFLISLPINDSYEQVQRTKEVLNKIPGGDELDFSFERSLSLMTGYMDYSDWQKLKKSLGPKITIADVGGELVISSKIKDKSNLDIELATDNHYHLGEQISEISLGPAQTFFTWRVADKVYASEDIEIIKKLISNRRDQQLSYLSNWSERNTPALLGDVEEFRRTFKSLPNHNLISIYIKDLGSGLSLDKRLLSEITYGEIVALLFDYLQDSNKAFAASVQATNTGLEFKTTSISKEKEGIKNSYSDSLASIIPARLRGNDITFFAQLNNPTKTLESLKDFKTNQGGASELAGFLENGLDINLDALTGRAGVIVSASPEGEFFSAIIYDYNNKSNADDVGAGLKNKITGILPNPVFEVTDEFLLIASDQETLLELKESLKQTKNSLAEKFRGVLVEGNDSFLYIETKGLVGFAKNVIEKSHIDIDPVNYSFQDSEIWRALEISSRIIPNISFLVSQNKDLTISRFNLRVDDVPEPQRREVARIFDRLSKAEAGPQTENTRSIRDSARRADILILQNAIAEFSAQNNRAPFSLEELAPRFISKTPLDPLNNAPYGYGNENNDSSFYVKMIMETDTSFGPAGVYCLTSAGVNRPDDGWCIEQ